MKALVFDEKLRFRGDYPLPRPSEGEALIKVSCAGVCSTDLEIINGYMGFKGVLGHEFTGIVEQCEERDFIGRRVTGEINIGCGRCPYCRDGLSRHCPGRRVLGILDKDGAFAEYLTLPFKNLHLIPDTLSDEEFVFVEPVAAAFEITEQVSITPETRVAVLGDGKLGLLVAQVLRLTGCDLTAVGRHRKNLSIVREMGIRTEVAAEVQPEGFDVVVDCTGSEQGLDMALKLTRPRGIVVLKTTVARCGNPDLNRVVIDEITVVGSRCGPFAPAISAITRGDVRVKPLISRVFPLEEGARALDYASGKGVLKVLIDMKGHCNGKTDRTDL